MTKSDIGHTPEFLRLAANLVESRLGLFFPEARHRELARGMASLAEVNGIAASQDQRLLLDKLSFGDPGEISAHFIIGETYFFREPGAFDALRGTIIPELMKQHMGDRQIRIWCAGCSTGEEAYSLAILMDEMIPDYRNWNVSILATDIHAASIKKAENGVYSKWSFRSKSAESLFQYFETASEGTYRIIPRIRSRVKFARLNLLDDFASSSANVQNFDIIFCRNVLMYFTPQLMATIVKRLRKCLRPEGYLFTSATETSSQIFSDFSVRHFPGAIIYKNSPRAKQNGLPPLPAGDSVPELRSLRKDRSLPAHKRAAGRPARASRAAVVPQAPRLRAAIPDPSATRGAELDAVLAKSRAAADMGQLKEAMALCESVAEAGKLEAPYHYLRASILSEMGQTEEAEKFLKQALYLDPEYFPAHMLSGLLAMTRNDQALAGKRLRQARSLLGSGAHGLTGSDVTEKDLTELLSLLNSEGLK